MLNQYSTDTTDLDETEAAASDTAADAAYRPIVNRAVAVFDDRGDAENAVSWLRSHGVPDDQISVMARSPDETRSLAAETRAQRVDADPGSDLARGAGTGLVTGAAAGALFGLAAAFVPGIGPFIFAGSLLHALGATGGAIVSGAIVGAGSGLVAGALAKWGLDQSDAHYYGQEVERGAILVGAELDGTPLTRSEVEDAFRRFHGRFAQRASP